MTILKQKPAIGLIFYPRFAPERLDEYIRYLAPVGSLLG